MILQRGVIIETKTAQNDAPRGLYNGYFAWASGRSFPGSPTFPVGPWGTQSDWAFGILAMEPFTGPSLSARIGPTGGYSSMLSLDIQVAQSDFMDYLRTRGIHLNRCRAWHYIILDGVFTIYGVGLIDNTKYSDTGTTLSCIDLFKYLHRDIPNVPVNTGEFPNAPTSIIGDPLPVSMGFVNDAKYLNTGVNNGKLAVFINGGTSHTVTGCINATGTNPPTYFLVVGPGITATPDWVGKTLVGYDTAGNAQAVKIVTALFTTYVLGAVTFNVVGVTTAKPFNNPVFTTVASKLYPTYWRPQYPNEVVQAGSESWIFEVWDFSDILILSQDKTYANVGDLKEYADDPANQSEKIFTPANQVQAIPYTERGGIVVETSNAKDIGTASLELWNSSYTPAFARFQGFRIKGLAVTPISSSFPSVGSDMPLVRNKVSGPASGYSVVLNENIDDTGGLSILVEVPVPSISDLAGGHAYLVCDSYVREASSSTYTGTNKLTFFPAIRLGIMANSGKSGLNSSVGNRVVTKPLNTIPGGEYLLSTQLPIKGTFFPVNFLPNFYFAGGVGQVASIGVPLLPDANAYFNADPAFENPNNATKTVLVEIIFRVISDSVLRNIEMVISQLGWVISRNALLVPPELYQSVIGEKYGDNWGSRRSTANPVEGIPNIIEDVLRSFDGQPDYVDTDSFDNALAFRPALGPFGWFAGSQLTDTKNSADVIDEACKNALLAMVPGLDGKRALVAWFDRMQPSYVATTLDKSKWTAGSLSAIEQEDSQDVYSEFQLNYDLNRASGVYNKNLQINYTAENDTFPEDEDSAWKTWVVGISDYATAKALWDQARAGFLQTGTKNRLVLDLPWLTDQFNGDPWAAALATLPPTSAAQLLLSMLVRWCAYPKRFVTGRIAITSASAALRLLDTVYFKDLVLTGNKRYYAWVTSLKVLESEIEVQLLWYPFNSPDEDSFLTQDNGVNTGYLVLDSGSDRIILN
ncbi:MAG: hypothetical protein V4498_00300 [candidate division FCPU426 bacterium]